MDSPPEHGLPAEARRLLGLALALTVPVTALAMGMRGPEAALGAAVGGVVSVLDLWLIARIVVAATASEDTSIALTLGALLLKLAAVGGIPGALILSGRVDGAGVLLGVSVVVVSVVLDFLFGRLRGSG